MVCELESLCDKMYLMQPADINFISHLQKGWRVSMDMPISTTNQKLSARDIHLYVK